MRRFIALSIAKKIPQKNLTKRLIDEWDLNSIDMKGGKKMTSK